MKITRIIPKPPPEITMTFPVDEGWVIIAALRDYAIANPGAARKEEWKNWANDLDAELRR